VTDTFS